MTERVGAMKVQLACTAARRAELIIHDRIGRHREALEPRRKFKVVVHVAPSSGARGELAALERYSVLTT